MTQAQIIQPAPRLPVSHLLGRELKRVIKERGFVIWLDADDNYSKFVDGLKARAASGGFPFPVFRFDGSFLELMLDLEKYGNGLHPEKVLVHMPGYNEQTISETPLYELFKAGKRYRKALDTLIEEACVGLVLPEEGKAFRETKPSLEEADRWLVSARAGEKDLFLVGLENYSPEAATELLSPTSRLSEDLKQTRNVEQFLEYMGRAVGLPATWPGFVCVGAGGEVIRPSDVRFVVASWLMAVEFVSDLAEPPATAELLVVQERDKSIIGLCRKLIELVRAQFADEYRALSGQFEDMLIQERQSHQPEALGSIDTFRFEEEAVRGASLSALHLGNWDAAVRYASERKPESCFWVRHDKNRERTWELIHLAADVGRELISAEKGLKGCTSLEEATHRYRDTLHRVDRCHRQFEQRFHKLHSTELQDEAALRDARDSVRREYRKWANALAGEFAKLCLDYGPLPSADLRQRGVYEQFVHPSVEGGLRTAYFMVDAMRYEMAEELKSYFESKKYQAVLHARLAELPTVTEVGMNALAPVAKAGRLRPVIKGRDFGGFRTGDQFTVSAPADRVRAMETRSLGAGAVNLELSDVTESPDAELKRRLRAKNNSPLIVVRSLELDTAGEKGFHLGTFERTLVQIREAVQRLQQLGVTHFVLVADHGFLLQDNTAELIEYKDSPKRRHVLSPERSGMVDALEIPLSALDYDVDEEAYLVFRKDTAVWKVKEKMAAFVHGGNSLQERVIPVLTLEKENRVGASTAHYEVVATPLPSHGGRERLELKVRLQKQSIGELSFGGPQRISLALRVQDQHGIPLDALPQIVEVTPPGHLESGYIMIPPSADAATVVFSLEGETDEMVRVEVYHPDATEKVTPKVVEGWFHMHRNRKLGPPKEGAPVSSRRAPSQGAAGMAEQADAAARGDWASGIDDEEFRKVFELIESQESINENELHMVLKSARRVYAFARNFDALRMKVPFEVQITTMGGMKSYVKGDKR
jgi:hypothetical protein